MKKILLLTILLFTGICTFSQTRQLSENSEISLITIGPGSYLFDKFGHTAIRVKDDLGDKVYNYGVYDFNTPNFYTKFARGKLLYKLDTEPFPGFVRRYVAQNRTVTEQVLNLNSDQKQVFYNFLEENALPENQEYLYDFFYDNCATKPRDVLKQVLGSDIQYDDSYLTEQKTFRQLIRQNVDLNSWGSLGMDVAIGAVTDKKATPWEHQYLPQFVHEALANTTIGQYGATRPLVKNSQVLYTAKETPTSSNFFTSPLFIFGILGLLILFITYKDAIKSRRNRILDGALFFITGVIGVFLLLLWFATDHSATANNYNLLWAMPLSLIATFGILKKEPKKWIQKYVFFLLLLLVLMVIHWITGVQSFAIGLIPLFIAMGVRYIYVFWYLKKILARR